MKRVLLLFLILVTSFAVFADAVAYSMGNGNYYISDFNNSGSGALNYSGSGAGNVALGIAGGYPQAGLALDYWYRNFDMYIELGVDYKSTKYLGFGAQMYLGYQFLFDKVFVPMIGAGATFGIGKRTYIAPCGMIGFKFNIGEHFMPFIKANLGYSFLNDEGFYWDAEAGLTYRF